MVPKAIPPFEPIARPKIVSVGRACVVVVLAVPFFPRKRNFDFFDGCFWGEFLGLSTWVFHSEVSLKYKFEISFNIVCRL